MSQSIVNPSTEGSSETGARSGKKRDSPLRPNKDAPKEAEQIVRTIVKLKFPDYGKAAVALAPVFGLGSDLLAGQRAQGLFTYRPFLEAFGDWAESCLEGRWDVPVAGWFAVLGILRSRNEEPGPPPDKQQWDMNDHYAHFIRNAMHDIRHPDMKSYIVYWIQICDIEDGWWVLFHALMYLQLDTMRFYKHRAPIKDRINSMLKRNKGT